MSQIKQVFEITAPNTIEGQSQTFTTIIGRCLYCGGKGYFHSRGFMVKYNKSFNPEIDPCPICKGTGCVQAKITVEFFSYGDKINIDELLID